VTFKRSFDAVTAKNLLGGQTAKDAYALQLRNPCL